MASIRVPFRLFGVRVPFLAYNLSISDPGFAALLQMGGQMGTFGMGGYGTYEALKFAAFYRGCALIAGTIASLPLRTYKNVDTDNDDDRRVLSSSFLDTKPSGPFGLTPFAWKELVAFNLISQGETGLIHLYSQGRQLIGLWPVNRINYQVEVDKTGQRHYKVQQSNGRTQEYSDRLEDAPTDELGNPCVLTQIVGMSLDGINGISPVALFQRGIQLSAAQEIAAMRQATSGMKASGLVTPAAEDITPDDAQAIQMDINNKMLGPDKAGSMILVNKRLTFTKWEQTNEESQFLELRRYAREEAALMLGLPMFMLEPSKQTSWGTGIEQQFLGLQKFTFMPITSRIEDAVSPLLNPSTKFVEFDYKGLLQGTPEIEVNLILKQVDSGLISEEEGRDLLGFGPKDPSDTFRVPAAVPPSGKLPEIPQPVPANGTAGAKMAK